MWDTMMENNVISLKRFPVHLMVGCLPIKCHLWLANQNSFASLSLLCNYGLP